MADPNPSPLTQNQGTSKRTFLQELVALATTFGLAGTAQAALPGDPGFQPARRPGMPGKRFGMLVDMRKCIGCQACTVSCSVENQPPIGQFRTTVALLHKRSLNSL